MSTNRYSSRLRSLLEAAEKTSCLPWQKRIEVRLKILDDLDALLSTVEHATVDPGLLARACATCADFQSAHETWSRSAHAEIACLGATSSIVRWLEEAARQQRVIPGPGFDWLDEVVCGILQIDEPVLHRPGQEPPFRSHEMTDYQPTPARHIFDAIAKCRLSPDDVFVDLGAGLGQVALLVNIFAGIRARGVEMQPHYAASAQRTAQRLHLTEVQFVAEDARTADLSCGTVFYMFTPFRGSILSLVLNRLEKESRQRPIRICALGPCTRVLEQQPWLTPNQFPDTEQITVFEADELAMPRQQTLSAGSAVPGWR
jgi:hypothetical protein